MARDLIILPRFKRDYRTARKHPDFEGKTLEYVFDVMISGGCRKHFGNIVSINAVPTGLASPSVILAQIFCSSTGCVATA